VEDDRQNDWEHEHDLRIVYKCDKCGHEVEYPPDQVEPESCPCSGNFNKVGESYNAN
jgi:hypothetical protein